MPLTKRISSLLSALAISLFAAPVFAGPGGSNLEKAGSEVTHYLIFVLGPLVFVLGLIFAMYSLFFGDERGVRRGINTVIAGVLLFAAPSVVEFIKNAVG